MGKFAKLMEQGTTIEEEFKRIKEKHLLRNYSGAFFNQLDLLYRPTFGFIIGRG